MAARRRGKTRPEDEPVAWLVELEVARKQNDFERAAEAKRQLERLGVRVTYRRKADKGESE